MVREKHVVTRKGKETTQSYDDSSDSPSEERESDAEFVVSHRPKRTQPQVPPARAQGRGRNNEGNPILQRKVIGARSKNASTSEEGDRYDDNIDVSRYVTMVVPPHPPHRTRSDPRLVDYKKKSNDIRPLRFQDSRTLPRSFFSDDRFWLAHQADWYESVILAKQRTTTEMKWIDWRYLFDLSLPYGDIARAVYNRCHDFGLDYLMRLQCDWSDEVVAQFYSTLYVDDNANIMHFALGGKRFSITLSEFATLFNLRGARTNNTFSAYVRLHDSYELEVTKMKFMYDQAYGKIQYGHPSGLTPYYKMLNLLFQNTLFPRGGNSDAISKFARNLLYQMAPGQPQFNACHFLWSEIIDCSIQGTGCRYAPYIFHLVKSVTKLDLKADTEHKSYTTPKGKLAESFRLGKHQTGLDPKGPLPGAYSIDGFGDVGASSSQAPPSAPSHGSTLDQLPVKNAYHSHGVPRNKKGKFDFIAKGLFACFNMGRQHARERARDREWMAEEIHRTEQRQKEIYAKLEMPHSPVRPLRTFDPPSPIANPWENLGDWVSDDEIEEDEGGEEHEDDDEDED